MDAMCMAAGMGSRLLPFTQKVPKPFLPLFGEPMAAFVLSSLKRVGIQNVVFNVHHLPDAARAAISGLKSLGLQLQISDESQQLLGSAGGIKKAEPLLSGESFLICNADTLGASDLRELLEVHQEQEKKGIELTLLLHPGLKTGSYREIVVDQAGKITAARSVESGKTFWSGVGILNKKLLKTVSLTKPSDFLEEILKPAIASGKAYGLRRDFPWLDIGTAELWWKAHLWLLRALETGACPHEWRELIEKKNKKTAPEAWVSQQLVIPPSFIKKGVYYSHHEQPSLPLGPDWIQYGECRAPKVSRGISFQGIVAHFEGSVS